jgi:hypothetical protein
VGPSTGAGNNPAHEALHYAVGTVRQLIVSAEEAGKPMVAQLWRRNLVGLERDHGRYHRDTSERPSMHIGSVVWLSNELSSLAQRKARVLVFDRNGDFVPVRRLRIEPGVVYLLPEDETDAPATDQR